MPRQVPADAVNVCPTRAVPTIAGGTSFTGASNTWSVNAEFADDYPWLAPPVLVAVTVTSMWKPESAATKL